jgi:hypothetical protein
LSEGNARQVGSDPGRQTLPEATSAGRTEYNVLLVVSAASFVLWLINSYAIANTLRLVFRVTLRVFRR